MGGLPLEEEPGLGALTLPGFLREALGQGDGVMIPVGTSVSSVDVKRPACGEARSLCAFAPSREPFKAIPAR